MLELRVRVWLGDCVVWPVSQGLAYCVMYDASRKYYRVGGFKSPASVIFRRAYWNKLLRVPVRVWRVVWPVSQGLAYLYRDVRCLEETLSC